MLPFAVHIPTFLGTIFFYVSLFISKDLFLLTPKPWPSTIPPLIIGGAGTVGQGADALAPLSSVNMAELHQGLAYAVLRPNNFYPNDYWFEAPIRSGACTRSRSGTSASRVDARGAAWAVVDRAELIEPPVRVS